jgi:hypothetical protein
VLLLLFNVALYYTITKARENQVGLKLCGKNQLLACADDVNLPGDNSMELNTNQEANRCATSRKVPRILWNPRFITTFTSALRLSLS